MAVPAAALMSLGYSTAIGLLIGLERGWAGRDEADGFRVAGFRTFALLGLLGGIASLIGGLFGAALVVLGGGVLALGYAKQIRTPDRQSATSAIAGLLVIGLGALAAAGAAEAALAGAAVTMLLLSNRQRLHAVVSALSDAEMRAAAQFAILALVLYPLAPDQPYGPLGAINPRHLLTVVVLVSGISFLAYLAGHHVSRGKGPLLVAATGALVSSTAVTAALARKLRTKDPETRGLITAVLIASVVSGLRLLGLIAILAPDSLGSAAIAVLPGIAVLATGVVWGWDGRQHTPSAWVPGNPIELGAAITFAAIAAAATLATNFAFEVGGASSTLATLMITGFADVDAAVLAFASLQSGERAALTGAALAVPVAANMFVKAGIAAGLSRSRAGAVAAAFLVAAGASMIGCGIAVLSAR